MMMYEHVLEELRAYFVTNYTRAAAGEVAAAAAAAAAVAEEEPPDVVDEISGGSIGFIEGFAIVAGVLSALLFICICIDLCCSSKKQRNNPPNCCCCCCCCLT